jgi:hypothetical protein
MGVAIDEPWREASGAQIDNVSFRGRLLSYRFSRARGGDPPIGDEDGPTDPWGMAVAVGQ